MKKADKRTGKMRLVNVADSSTSAHPSLKSKSFCLNPAGGDTHTGRPYGDKGVKRLKITHRYTVGEQLALIFP